MEKFGLADLIGKFNDMAKTNLVASKKQEEIKKDGNFNESKTYNSVDATEVLEPMQYKMNAKMQNFVLNHDNAINRILSKKKQK